MTETGIDYNLGKLMYYYGMELQIYEAKGSTAKWFLDILPRYLDWNGGPLHVMGTVNLVQEDYNEIKEQCEDIVIQDLQSYRCFCAKIQGYLIYFKQVTAYPETVYPVKVVINKHT